MNRDGGIGVCHGGITCVLQTQFSSFKEESWQPKGHFLGLPYI